MSRNGSGTYNRVPGSAYTNGTTADGSELDAEMNDIASALTQSLSLDGQTVPTANFNWGGYQITNVTISGINLTASGVITGAAGSAGSPSIVASGAATTGIFFPTTAVGISIGGTEAVRVASNSSVGVNTSTPNLGSFGRALTVNGSGAQAATELAYGGALQAYFASDNSTAKLFSYSNIPLTFGANNSEVVRIKSTYSGQMIVGAVSDWTGAAKLSGFSSATGWAMSAYSTAASGGAYIARVDNTAAHFADWYAGAVQVGSISTNGSVTAYNTSSDARLKDNIADASIDSGAVIDAVQVRSWTWKSDGTIGLGFVAQELQKVAPEAVADGPWLGVDASKLLPYVIRELQSLRRRVAELEG